MDFPSSKSSYSGKLAKRESETSEQLRMDRGYIGYLKISVMSTEISRSASSHLRANEKGIILCWHALDITSGAHQTIKKDVIAAVRGQWPVEHFELRMGDLGGEDLEF